MDFVPSILAAIVGAVFGWFAAALQHHLYSEPEHRANPAAGRRLLLMRAGLALACAVSGALAFRPGHYDTAPAALAMVFALGLLVLASTDFERRRIPNKLSYPLIAAAVLLSWAWPDRSVADIALGAGFALGVAIILFGLGVFVFGSAALGLGDVKLMLLIGLLLGWPATMTALFIGVVLAGIPALVLTVMGRGRKFFSYGPYLIAGALVPLLFPANFV